MKNGSKSIEIKDILESNPKMPVLFVSDPQHGDVFMFGTLEELENELEVYREEGNEEAELTVGCDLLLRLDFETYRESPPQIFK
jgi:hypothetical protein